MEEKIKKAKIKIGIKKFLISNIVLFTVFCALSMSASAASLYFSPSSGQYSIGKTISVGVYVSSADQAMNAASGVVSFPQDKLEVTSLSKSGSIFSLWVQEPTFSNSSGKVNFEGIVLNPGFKGSGGKILTINFKAKTSGNANCSISSASVLANDGAGTNILTGAGSASFSIGDAKTEIEEVKETPPKPVTGVPGAPKIISSTHPDSDKWYALKEASFSWGVSKDITGVSLLITDKENVVPTVTYSTAINSKELKDLDDGVWYFNVRLRNSKGWGAVSSFKLQIDTEKPESFDIKQINGELKGSEASFVFTATDKTSGIDYYDVKINDNNFEKWSDFESGVYKTGVLNPGKYTLTVKAVDKAGNFLEKSLEFEISGLESPTITEYSKDLKSGETLIIKGKTYPNSEVIIWMQKGKSKAINYNIRSDESGNFIFTREKLSRGEYSIWAEVQDEFGVKSAPSSKVNVIVKFGPIVNWKIDIPVFGFLFVVLILIASYFFYKFIIFKKRIRKEIYEAKAALHRSFEFIRKNTQREIALFDKIKTRKQLGEEIERVNSQLKKDFDNAERIVKKEIDDIEKRVAK